MASPQNTLRQQTTKKFGRVLMTSLGVFVPINGIISLRMCSGTLEIPCRIFCPDIGFAVNDSKWFRLFKMPIDRTCWLLILHPGFATESSPCVVWSCSMSRKTWMQSDAHGPWGAVVFALQLPSWLQWAALAASSFFWSKSPYQCVCIMYIYIYRHQCQPQH